MNVGRAASVSFSGETTRQTGAVSRMEGVRLGNETGVRAAYAAHGGELYRFALRALGDAGAAEEAVQETFLRAWRAGERFDPSISSLRTWLFAIARNVVIDIGRSRASRPPLTSEEGDAISVDDPIDQVMIAWQIEEALRRISNDHRVAIVETYYRGRPHAEVAEELGVPEGTLRSRIFYGLKALRLALEEMGWDAGRDHSDIGNEQARKEAR